MENQNKATLYAFTGFPWNFQNSYCFNLFHLNLLNFQKLLFPRSKLAYCYNRLVKLRENFKFPKILPLNMH